MMPVWLMVLCVYAPMWLLTTRFFTAHWRTNYGCVKEGCSYKEPDYHRAAVPTGMHHVLCNSWREDRLPPPEAMWYAIFWPFTLLNYYLVKKHAPEAFAKYGGLTVHELMELDKQLEESRAEVDRRIKEHENG